MTKIRDIHNRMLKIIIMVTFLVAMLLDFMPFPTEFFFWIPQFTALILLYWAINHPQKIGVGWSFIIGLLVDIGTASPLGQHALSYMLITFLIQQQQRQIVLYNYGLQAIAVFIALLCNQIILMVVRLMYDHRFMIDFPVLSSTIIGAFLWPLFNKIMLNILNSRRLHR